MKENVKVLLLQIHFFCCIPFWGGVVFNSLLFSKFVFVEKVLTYCAAVSTLFTQSTLKFFIRKQR